MPELEAPTDSEREAEEFLRRLIEQVCGDPAQTEWHLWSCRRRSLDRTGTRFSNYLITLAAELPLLLTDPAACRHAFATQQLINRAQASIAEKENDE